MATWSSVPTAAVVDPNNAANILIIFTATNSATGEVVTDSVPSSNWTPAKEQSYRQDQIARLVARDATRATTTANLPNVAAYIAGKPAPITG